MGLVDDTPMSPIELVTVQFIKVFRYTTALFTEV